MFFCIIFIYFDTYLVSYCYNKINNRCNDEHDLVDLFSDALSLNGYDVSVFTDPIVAFENIKGILINILC